MSITIKTPAETARLTPDFGGVVTALGDMSARRRDGELGSLAFAATLGVGIVSVAVSGGQDGERYLVTIIATRADGAVVERGLEIAIVEGGWVLPDGGVPYLSIDAFVKRFGLDEVVAMTDGDGSGRIDRDLLMGALGDAQAIVDGYLAGRYAVPLATIPPIIAMSVADLARARLYPRGAPEGVAEQARAAEARLRLVQAGSLRLNLPDAASPVAQAADPILFTPGLRVYRDGLQEY